MGCSYPLLSKARFSFVSDQFPSLNCLHQGIEPLLDNLFSFLRRKTDFYTGATPVMAEELVLKVVRKHSALAEKEDAEKKKLREKEELAKKKKLQEKLKRVCCVIYNKFTWLYFLF